MGADLLLVAMVHDENTKLDWRAGREHVRRMLADDVLAALEEMNGEAPTSVVEARREANAVISELKKELKDETARDAYTWKIRGAVMHIRGGTSWGEDPSDGWTAFVNAYYFRDVLRTIGFEVDA